MFHKCKTAAEKKSLYRRLSKKLHPDCGGDAELMTLLTESYELALNISASDRVVWPKSPSERDIYDAFENAMRDHARRTAEQEKKEPAWDGIYTHVDFKVFKDSKRLVILDEILIYSKHNKKFNSEFPQSIKNFLNANGFITEKQYNCLVDLYYSRKIDKWIEENAD